jgi:hypothetical protein
MPVEIASVDAPSLLDIRQCVKERCLWAILSHETLSMDLDRLTNAICVAIFHVAASEPWRWQPLSMFAYPAELAEHKAWLEALCCDQFADVIAAVDRNIEAWHDSFWEAHEGFRQGGGRRIQQVAFRETLATSLLGVLSTQSRQHILACYGETR